MRHTPTPTLGLSRGVCLFLVLGLAAPAGAAEPQPSGTQPPTPAATSAPQAPSGATTPTATVAPAPAPVPAPPPPPAASEPLPPPVAERQHAFVLWRPPSVQDGSILPIELDTPAPCDRAEAEWLDDDVPLFAGPTHWHALLPVPLGQKGVLSLVVRCGPRAARFRIAVHEGTYPVSRLTVDPKFSKPPPPRAAVEQQAINRAYGSGSADPLWAQDFLRPVPTPESSPYGVRRTFNEKLASRHYGLDYEGAVGDPIRAANDGVVVLAGDDYFFTGNCVFVDHGGGLFTVYFHMSKLEVKTGEKVKRGQVLGLIGATGRVTGPHLHFGVKLLGQYVNPVDLLRLRTASQAAPSASAAAAR